MKATRGIESLQFTLFACVSRFSFSPSLFVLSIRLILEPNPQPLELNLNKNHNMDKEIFVNNSMS